MRRDENQVDSARRAASGLRPPSMPGWPVSGPGTLSEPPDCAPVVPSPRSALDVEAVKAAYQRWAGVYDGVFGGISAFGRRRAVASVIRLDAW